MRTLHRPSRRAVLLGLGTLALAGSTAACDLPGPGEDAGTPETKPDPDRRRVEAARAQAAELLALVEATALAHPGLAPRLTGLTECHRAHLRVLTEADDRDSDDQGSEPTATTTPSGSAAPSPSPLSSPEAALRQLVARERAHVTALTTEAGVAESGALARLLATMAAGIQMYLEPLAGEA